MIFLLLVVGMTNFETATFAGGCFWCLEKPFDQIEGVEKTTVGYTGGDEKNPTYEQVSSGTTGHAEAIEILFDPKKVSYGELLDVFWKNIDPAAKDRQFCDVGRQYRSAIFFHNEEQKKLAESSKKAILDQKIVPEVYTEIVAAKTFYPAEEYHQEYYEKNPLRYKFYRYNCGRDKRLREVWENR